jgi:hypothetical protein
MAGKVGGFGKRGRYGAALPDGHKVEKRGFGHGWKMGRVAARCQPSIVCIADSARALAGGDALA